MIDAAIVGLGRWGKTLADAVASRAPYPISTGEMRDTVATFEAIVEAVIADGRIREV